MYIKYTSVDRAVTGNYRQPLLPPCFNKEWKWWYHFNKNARAKQCPMVHQTRFASHDVSSSGSDYGAQLGKEFTSTRRRREQATASLERVLKWAVDAVVAVPLTDRTPLHRVHHAALLARDRP